MRRLVSLLLAATFSAGLASAAAGGTPPVAFTTFDGGFTGTTGICGFPVEYTVEIQWKARSFEERGHAFTNIVNYHVDWNVQGNGRTAIYHEAYTETFFPSNAFPDLLVVRAQHGLTFGIRLDGAGLVTRDAGTLVFLPGGTIVVVDGHHPTELAGGLEAAFGEICRALSG